MTFFLIIRNSFLWIYALFTLFISWYIQHILLIILSASEVLYYTPNPDNKYTECIPYIQCLLNCWLQRHRVHTIHLMLIKVDNMDRVHTIHQMFDYWLQICWYKWWYIECTSYIRCCCSSWQCPVYVFVFCSWMPLLANPEASSLSVRTWKVPTSCSFWSMDRGRSELDSWSRKYA